MADPQPPWLPETAPQDLRDFVSCKSKTVTLGGEIDWLPGKPKATVTPGPTPGTATIQFEIDWMPDPQPMPATIKDGELSIDTSKLPAGKEVIDTFVRDLNAWLKFNKWCLGKPLYGGGKVTLTKVPCPVPGTGVAPPGKPIPPATPPTTKPTPTAPPPATAPLPAEGGGCKVPFIGMLLLLLTVLMIGAVAFVPGLLVGNPTADATATPIRPSASPSPAPTPTPVRPSPSPTRAPTPIPATLTPSPMGTVTAAPPTATPTSQLVGLIERICARVIHQAVGRFISYIDWELFWEGYDVDYFELVLGDTNAGEPVVLDFDPATGTYLGTVGLEGAGGKPILQFVAYLKDGSTVNLTDDLIEYLGSATVLVRYPEQDTYGECL